MAPRKKQKKSEVPQEKVPKCSEDANQLQPEEKVPKCSEDANQLQPEEKVPQEIVPCDQPNRAQETEPQPTDSVAAVTSTETTKKGNARGVSRMYKVLVKKAQGKKIKVRCDMYGEPIGETRHMLESYVGMVGRNMIPIDISTWPNVDRQLKDNLWRDVQDTFKVPEELESHVLKSAGVKWRQFKTKLTSQYVMPYLQDKKQLRKPPKKYAFVGKEAWKKFVAQRTSESWQPLRKNQSERVKERKYPHRTARKGYKGLLEEEVKAGKLEPGERPDRAIMWKKARKRKDGNIDLDVEEVFDKIDELLEKKEKGEFQVSGITDVLSTALEKEEHSGRVRGVGGFVTPKIFFNLPKGKRTRITKAELLARDRQRDEELEKTKQEMQMQIDTLKAMISPVSEKESCHKPDDQEATQEPKIIPKKLFEEDEHLGFYTPPTGKKVPRKCELAVDNIENKVAFGMVLEEDSMNQSIHGKPMPSGCVRVLVDGVIKKDALVPVPVCGEIEKVQEAVGSQLAWPLNLIVYSTMTKTRKKKDLQGLQVKALKDKESHHNVPSRFKLLYRHAKSIMKDTGTSIPIPCAPEVFGIEKIIYILHENVIALLEYDMLGQSAICAYMAYLHTVVQKNEDLEVYAFCDPGATFTLNKDFESYVVNRLKEGNPDRLFLMPHNQSKHWILAIIWNGDIYLCNPLAHPLKFPALEKALSSAVKSFNAETGRGSKPPVVKNLVGSPKQPGGYECGYVVMRYMKEIIFDKEMTFISRWATKTTRVSYQMKDLDDVRFEAAAFIEDKM